MATPTATEQLAPHKKLHGRQFYESIGSPRYVLAPMVDQSEFAWRMLTRSFMPSGSKDLLAYSPMLHARIFSEEKRYRKQNFEPTIPHPDDATVPIDGTAEQASRTYLDGNRDLDRPLFVQFCANDPDKFLQAARHVEGHCDAVDLNLGCPQGIARKGNYGAFLQEQWDTIYRLINTLHKELSIPVTAKFRIFETKEKSLEYAKMILSAGASIITVHGRLREQKGHNTGLADWETIRYLRDNLPADTVMFANGNILQHGDLERCMEATKVDGVMSAEGNLHDPTIFAEAPAVGEEGCEYWRGYDGRGGYRIDAVFRRYMDIIYKYVLEVEPPIREPLFMISDKTKEACDEHQQNIDENDQPPRKRQKRNKEIHSINLKAMQSHLFNLLRPLVSKHTNVRDALARSKAGDIEAYENVLRLTEQAVKQGLVDYEQSPQDFAAPQAETSEDEHSSSAAAIARCARPYWICQPYVRPTPKEALEKGALAPSKKEKAVQEKGKIAVGLETSQEEGVGEERPLPTNPMEKVSLPSEGLVCG